MGQEPAADTPGSSSSDSLVDEANNEGLEETSSLELQTYMKNLPTKDSFRALIAGVKETCRTEIATNCQDLNSRQSGAHWKGK